MQYLSYRAQSGAKLQSKCLSWYLIRSLIKLIPGILKIYILLLNTIV